MSGSYRRQETGAGRLRTRIQIQQEQRTDDGQGGYTMTWGGAGFQWNAWAEKLYVTGGETVELEQAQSRRRFTYRIRNRKDVTVVAGMRVVDGTLSLTITAVANDDLDLAAQVIHCIEVAPT